MPVANLVRTAEKNKTLLYLLPTEATTTVVQLQPSLAISVLIPPATRKVIADFFTDSENPHEFELRTPDLVWTQLLKKWKLPHREELCRCIKCNISSLTNIEHRSYKGADNPYQYFVHTPDFERCSPDIFWASDYSVANIDNGYVCWGGIAYPPSLRQANIMFWHSRLNNSPDRYRINHYFGNRDAESRNVVNKKLAECMLNYKPEKYFDRHSFIFGNKYIATSETTKAVLLSFDSGLTSEFDTCSNSCLDSEQVSAVIGFANRNPDLPGWTIDLPSSENFSLLDEDLILR